jgi:L-serine dehydratase
MRHEKRDPVSILNQVIGPVMRGPSSSHTAGAFRLAALSRALLGQEPAAAQVLFDPQGSYGQVFAEQGADRAFALGILGRSLLDREFHTALASAAAAGVTVRFRKQPLPDADHPNTVHIALEGQEGKILEVVGRSIGGGAIEVTRLQQWPVLFTGEGHEIAVELDADATASVAELLEEDREGGPNPEFHVEGARVLLTQRRQKQLPEGTASRLAAHPAVSRIFVGTALLHPQVGAPLFRSGGGLIQAAEDRNLSLGQVARQSEALLLGLTEASVNQEMRDKLDIMLASVEEGLGQDPPAMQLLEPSAGAIYAAEAADALPTGGLHTRAAARAMATMHVNGGMGVVCAAPTAGSAGVLPGVLSTLTQDRGLSRSEAARCLWAAGAIGQIVAERATFAAEVAGCQVEIGAAGAMAAAAVVEMAGGSPGQACDAAAIAFQNTMGSVCDLVQGMVEIPCHTRNALAASSAFVCADLILGGYQNPIPLDETIDAVYDVGRMLPSELRCTARGGLALAPSARALKGLQPPSTPPVASCNLPPPRP